MGLILYFVLLIYFIIGSVMIYVINKNKNTQDRNQNWLKFITYFLIINTLFFSISIKPIVFHYLCLIIILFSYLEIINLTFRKNKFVLGGLALFVLSIFSYGFYRFSIFDKNIILYVFSIVAVFDASSQITGQLIGKRKLMSKISPNKTIEGLTGGFVFSILTSIFIHELLGKSLVQSIYLGFGIALFAFCGDISASYLKRKFDVKDYSALIPGHGGFLDRFDSLIMGGAFIFFIYYIQQI